MIQWTYTHTGTGSVNKNCIVTTPVLFHTVYTYIFTHVENPDYTEKLSRTLNITRIAKKNESTYSITGIISSEPAYGSYFCGIYIGY